MTNKSNFFSLFKIIVLFSLVLVACSPFYHSDKSTKSDFLISDSYSYDNGDSKTISNSLPESTISSSRSYSFHYSQSDEDYYSSYLDDKIYTLSKINEQNQISYTFAFITDLHWTENAKQSPLLLQRINEQIGIEKVVLGGDYITSVYEDAEEAKSVMRDCTGAFSMFDYTAVVGNHDANSVGGQGNARIPDVEIFNVINNCNSEHPYGVEYNYSKKLCLLFLNTGINSFSDNSQKQFLRDRLNELGKDWFAMIFLHIIFDGSYENNNESVIQYAGKEFTNYLDSFASQLKCSIIGAFSGHSHLDYLNTTSYACPVITTMCDSLGVFNPRYNIYRREANTCSEQAFDIVQIDTVKRRVYLTRIGCGADRRFDF